MSEKTKVIQHDTTVYTSGLTKSGCRELRAVVNDPHLLGDCKFLVSWLVNYIENGARIESEQTIEWGFWLLQFRLAGDDMYDLWEYKADGSEFTRGVTTALTYWRDQRQTCKRANADFKPPWADKKAAISDGVLDGDPVTAVRYPSPEHMSGWWMFTDRYNGDVNTLRIVHLYHVSAARPELARFFALPFGYRFTSSPERIWFDQDAADQTVS